MKISMMDKRSMAGLACLLGALPLLTACGGNYYQVTDAGSGKSYYTRDIDNDDGHFRFTDKRSGDEVNLDSAEVREITPQQYKNAVRQ